MKFKKYLPTVLFVAVVVVGGYFALDYLGKNNPDSKQLPDPQKSDQQTPTIETVDQPLERKTTLNYPEFKTVKVSVADVSEGKAYVLNYEFDLENLNYRVDSDLEGGFYYAYVNGIVCFGKPKPKFKNSFCVREKYTPAGLVAFLAHSIDTPARELKPDEKEISRIMTEAGWVPQQYLSAFMIRSEVILKLLQAKQLNLYNIVLEWEDAGKMLKVGTVSFVEFSQDSKSFALEGIHLAKVMFQSLEKGLKDYPRVNFFTDATDAEFLKFLQQQDFNLQDNILKQ